MGGGVGISCIAPIRVCMENSVYAMPESKIGYFTDVGASYFLPRIHDNFSMGLYLAITGKSLRGEDLLSWGLATHYMKSENLDSFREEIQRKVSKNTSFLEV